MVRMGGIFSICKSRNARSSAIGADRALGQDHIVGGGVLRQLKGLIQRQLVPGGDVCQCQPLRLCTFLQAGKDGVFGLAVPFHPEVGD